MSKDSIGPRRRQFIRTLVYTS